MYIRFKRDSISHQISDTAQIGMSTISKPEIFWFSITVEMTEHRWH